MSFLLHRPPPITSLTSLTSLSHLTPKSLPPFANNLLPRTFSTTSPRPLARMTIVGRLAAEPELVPTASGNDMVRYALGTSHGPRDNRQTSWWRVACFVPEGGLRDLIMGLGKGSMIYLEGDASMRKYQKADETVENTLNIVQQKIEILDKRPHSSDEPTPTDESEESTGENESKDFPRPNGSYSYTRGNENENETPSLPKALDGGR